MKETRRERLLREIAEQQKWIADRGGSLASYIRRYGDPGVPPVDEEGKPKTISDIPFKLALSEKLVAVSGQPGVYYEQCFGDGGTAIWNADNSHLRQLESELEFHRV